MAVLIPPLLLLAMLGLGRLEEQLLAAREPAEPAEVRPTVPATPRRTLRAPLASDPALRKVA